MTELQEIADRHDLLVVEDAAQAHGARLGDRLVGSFGDAGSFSFYGNKVITSGEGGMATFRDPKVDAFARRLRNQGTDPGPGPLHHSVVGFNYRMTSLQAAVGLGQLGRIDDVLAARHDIDRWYRAALAALPLAFQPRRAGAEPVLWMFVVLIDDDAGISLDNVQAELRNRGIDTRRMYQPITSFPPYARSGRFPATDEIARRGLVLPTFVGMTESDVLRVADALKAVLLRA
jgi:perosamine synthetase